MNIYESDSAMCHFAFSVRNWSWFHVYVVIQYHDVGDPISVTGTLTQGSGVNGDNAVSHYYYGGDLHLTGGPEDTNSAFLAIGTGTASASWQETTNNFSWFGNFLVLEQILDYSPYGIYKQYEALQYRRDSPTTISYRGSYGFFSTREGAMAFASSQTWTEASGGLFHFRPAAIGIREILPYLTYSSKARSYVLSPSPLLFPWISNYEKGRLCMEAVQSKSFVDVNMIAYVADLVKLKESILALRKLSSFRPKNPKTWGNLWLSFRYGLRLTVADTKSIFNAFDRVHELAKQPPKKQWVSLRSMSKSSISFQGRQVNSVYHYKTRVNNLPGSVMNFVRFLQEWDIWPSLQNCYDLIPLSFVVDWFIPIGDMLEQIDTEVLYQYYSCVGTTVSQKHTVSLPSVQIGPYSIPGDVVATAYVRDVTKVFDLPYFDLDLSFPSSANQVLDAIALLVQKS